MSYCIPSHLSRLSRPAEYFWILAELQSCKQPMSLLKLFKWGVLWLLDNDTDSRADWGPPNGLRLVIGYSHASLTSWPVVS